LPINQNIYPEARFFLQTIAALERNCNSLSSKLVTEGGVMNNGTVRFLWQDAAPARDFRTGVCLHGHTLYSQECLDFLPRYLHHVPGVSQVVRGYQQPRRNGQAPVDFSRAFWTPPLTPASALHLERKQIAKLGLAPLVSLTDHDSIDAGLALQVTANRSEVPVSVEWTVPYEKSILHFGIHNLPAHIDRAWMAAMAAFTSAPDEAHLPEMLRALAAIPEVLVVLNHPLWLEEGVEKAAHPRALERLFRECLESIHAFELNGTRGWKENADTIALARAHSRPIVSGGDRHACEPSACLNLTNAGTFAEFAAEIREGHTTLLFMPQYREPMALRILQATGDILRRYPEYPGRVRWTDRVYYRGEDGIARPLSVIWNDRAPWMVAGAASAVEFVATTKVRSAIRLLLVNQGEILP
jgi:hypothetical protein